MGAGPLPPEPRWPLPDRNDLRDALLAAYDAPDRGYHDRQHLIEVLARLEELAEPGDDLDVLRLAAWFHDAVYEGAADDEARSAQWAAQALGGRTGAEVARLVRLTASHAPERDDRAGILLCDADLAILAAPPERYADYLAGVRRDFAHVDDDTFAAGRAAVVRDLLERDALFRSAHGFARWEARARGNLRSELAPTP